MEAAKAARVSAIEVADEIKRGRNKLAATVVIGHGIKHIYNSGLQSILLPEIKLGLGLSATELGSLAFSRQATGWGTTMAAGYLGDRFAHRSALMLAISLGLMGASYFFAGTANSYWVLFAAMLLVGIGPSLYHPPAIGSLSRRFPDKRGFAISLHGTGGSVGEMLGPLATAGALALFAFYGAREPWRGVLMVSLFPAIFAAFMIWSMMRSIPGEVPGTPSFRAYLVSLWGLLRKKAMLLLVFVTALRSMGQSAIMIFLPVYLREDLAYQPYMVALFLSLAQVVGIGAQPAMGFLSDRFGRKVILVPAMTFMAFMFFALKLADPGIQLIVTILGLGAFLYSLHTIFIAAAMDVAEGTVQSTVVSLIYGASFLGTISPVLSGMVVDTTGDTTNAFVYGGVILLLATLLLAVMRLPKTANQIAAGPRGH